MNARTRREKLLEHLRRGLRSAPDLAARLGVTERTIRRDVRELRVRGVGIERVMGRNGGFRLTDDSPVTVELEPSQIRELVAAVLYAARNGALLTGAKVDGGRAHEELIERLLTPLPARRERGVRKLLLGQGVPRQSKGFRSMADVDQLERGVLDQLEIRIAEEPRPNNHSYLGEPEALELTESGWHVPVHVRCIGFTDVPAKRLLLPTRTLFGCRALRRRLIFRGL